MSRVKIFFAILGVLAITVAAIWYVWIGPQVAYAKVATAYGAKKVCSCLYLTNRSEASCLTDFTEDVSAVNFEITPKAVSAHVLGGLVSETAQYVEGQGCRLVQ